MTRNALSLQLVLLLTLVGLMALPSSPAVAAESRPPVATIRVGPALVEWTPLVESSSIVLSVADPRGEVRTFHFSAGEAPALSLFDDRGAPLPDGTYAWELRGKPRADRMTAPLTESGYFTISDGGFVASDLVEPPEILRGPSNSTALNVTTAADQMVPDDLIVDGKGCIGLGCVNNEVFSQETLRLKQSVVRLRFEDTSGTAGFPTRDWQLTVNDSNSGGADRFSVEDLTANRTPFTIRGNAPADALVVDASGKVGLRTATPAQDVHIASGNTPALRLEQTTGGGFPARTWDVSASDTAFTIKDVTGATTTLQIRPGAPTDSVHVGANGNVGLGTSSPGSRLHLANGVVTIGGLSMGERSGAPQDLQITALRNVIYNVDSDLNSTNASFSVSRDGNPNLVIFVAREDNLVGINRQFPSFPLHVGTDATNGNGAHVTVAGIWADGSSRLNKENIRALGAEDAFAALGRLEPVRYTGKNSSDGEEYLGFIAEDVPDLVAMNNHKALSPMDFVAVLTRVVQEQEKRIAELEAALAELRENR